jgi:hypothetical protein
MIDGVRAKLTEVEIDEDKIPGEEALTPLVWVSKDNTESIGGVSFSIDGLKFHWHSYSQYGRNGELYLVVDRCPRCDDTRTVRVYSITDLGETLQKMPSTRSSQLRQGNPGAAIVPCWTKVKMAARRDVLLRVVQYFGKGFGSVCLGRKE